MRRAAGSSPREPSGENHQGHAAGWIRARAGRWPIETANLYGLVQSCLDEPVVGCLGRLLRLGAPEVHKAVDAVLPPLLVVLVSALSRRRGASGIAAAFEGVDESLLDRLDGVLSDTGLPMTRDLGSRAMQRLFGDAAAARLVSRAARYSQFDIDSARALLEILTPIAVAVAQRLMRTRGFGPDGLECQVAVAHDAQARWVGEIAPACRLSPRRGFAGPPSGPPSTSHSLHRPVAVVLALAWSLLLGYWALPMQGRPVAVAEEAAASSLSVSYIGSQIEYFGVVDDERSQSSILEVLSGIFGEGNLVGDLRVDGRVSPPPWLPSLRPLLLASRRPGAELRLAGSRIGVATGRLSDSAQMVHRLRVQFGDHFAVGLHERQPSPSALAMLDTGSPSADLLTLLGAWVIHFPPDSDELPGEHRPLIRRAARLMEVLPEGAVVEVIGHTDDTGDTAVNVTLSRVRAESVREALIDAGAHPSRVRARGCGSETPIAANDRPEGRSMNRRIEFLVRYD